MGLLIEQHDIQAQIGGHESGGVSAGPASENEQRCIHHWSCFYGNVSMEMECNSQQAYIIEEARARVIVCDEQS